VRDQISTRALNCYKGTRWWVYFVLKCQLYIKRSMGGALTISANLTERTPFPVGEVIVNSSPKVWGR
jgi:hypothetical protein